MSNSEGTSTSQIEATAISQEIQYLPGTFCWWELTTYDGPAAKNFYTSLFGWTAVDTPMTEGVYTLFQVDGKDAAAMHQMGQDMKDKGVPPNWLSYVYVTSADEVAGRVAENGGTLIMSPFDVGEHGRMAVIQDPTGGVFAIWEPKAYRGAAHACKPGGAMWNELGTTNVEAAGEFYTKVLGWTPNPQPMGDMMYTMFDVPGLKGAAGMMQNDPAWGEIPSHWTTYFWVTDCDATVAKAKELGATITFEPMDVEGVGRMAGIMDPQGASFAVVKMVDAEQPS